jgi:general transcription factor 3C polypeptide 1
MTMPLLMVMCAITCICHRTSGVTQTALGKCFGLEAGKFCYVVKSLQSRGLVVGNRAMVKSNSAGGGMKVVSTNSLHLSRYAKQSNVSSYQRIEITEREPGSDEEINVDALQEEDGTLNKSHVSVHDYLPAMKAVCDKLEEASGKVNSSLPFVCVLYLYIFIFLTLCS